MIWQNQNLRIIISINSMTGGQFGAYGYLNYLKNNICAEAFGDSDRFIVETKDGRKDIVSLSQFRSSRKTIHFE